MTDTTLSLTGLTEAAKESGVTTDQARTILEAAGVKVEPEKPALPTDPESVIIATEVRGVTGKWRMLLDNEGEWLGPEVIRGWQWHHPDYITAWTEAVVVPAGKQIDPADVREGDRVRLELDSGDEVTFTVIRVREAWFLSRHGTHARDTIRAVYLLDREGEA